MLNVAGQTQNFTTSTKQKQTSYLTRELFLMKKIDKKILHFLFTFANLENI